MQAGGHIARELVRHDLTPAAKEQFEGICSVLRRAAGCGHRLGWLDNECPEVTFILRTGEGYAYMSCSVDTCHACCESGLLESAAEGLGCKLRRTSVYSLVYLGEELGAKMGQCACSDFRAVLDVNTSRPEQQQARQADTA